MGSHPINLAVRFILEIIALISVGIWGWNKTDSFLKFVLAIGLPILLGAIWGTFAVPDDPSRSGQTVIVTSGVIRLVIELGIFTIATLAIYNQGQQKFSYIFAIIVIIHYLISYDRILWLLEN
jgi:hypothetical protein